MRHKICKSCQLKGRITMEEEQKCKDIAANEYRRKIKAVKVWCSGESDDSTTCAGPVLGSSGYINWGNWGAQLVCPCVSQFIEDCAGKGAFCALNKVQNCPKVCAAIRGQGWWADVWKGQAGCQEVRLLFRFRRRKTISSSFFKLI